MSTEINESNKKLISKNFSADSMMDLIHEDEHNIEKIRCFKKNITGF